eukprot:TRINITY_DN1907_c0_g2_i1.p1 TRINITY_DN1907_c0_g2~~TRINITY_DN1907_c0_g2_i1.p1  ORF type:complete len:360 (+),score=75.78 TRINITY_DN1907_c0_g2_i1:435-1514(+)
MDGPPMLFIGGLGGMGGGGGDGLSLELPKISAQLQDFLSESGSYMDGGLVIKSTGGMVPQDDAEVAALADLDVLHVLGRGSSAVVSLVKHRVTGREYALKEVEMSIEESVRSQMKKELEINKQKRSHVVECYQAFYAEGRFSMVLEYMDAGSLADILKNIGRVAESDLAVVARQAFQGLQSLHNDHIIHRDIKPSNIMISRNGQVKITDFGVSTVLTSTLDVGKTYLGTYMYMSPERISGAGEGYKYNSDTWSMGLSILECAIGFFPYHRPGGWGNALYDFLNTVMEKPAPGANVKHFSPEFCDFIAACLQKDPKLRPNATECLAHPFIQKYWDQELSEGFFDPGEEEGEEGEEEEPTE